MLLEHLNKRRGLIEGTNEKSGATIINAKVPLSEMFGYVTDLRTITSGRATSTMEFFNFEEAPKNIAQEVINKVKKIEFKVMSQKIRIKLKSTITI